MSALEVFLSHTSLLAHVPEGRSFVQAALDAIAAAGHVARDMRYFTADERPPADVCREAVRRCQAYVGLFGLDYGSPVRGAQQLSYTELEFLTALEPPALPVFAFLLDPKGAPVESRQEDFRRRVRDAGVTAVDFSTPDRLEHLLFRTLRERLAPAATGDRRLQHLPYLPANFTGRRADLDEAERQVRAAISAGTALSFVGFRGMGGIGKTALAAALAERLAADGRLFPGGVLWANLLDRTAEDAARDWARDLGGDVAGLGPEQCLTRFHELAAARRPLVVLDNVPRGRGGDSPAARLLVRARGVVTLVTTRFREAVPAGVSVREVEALTPTEAADLLRSHIGERVDADRVSADAVLGQCGRLPLFVNVAGRAVANGYYSLAEYAGELRRRGLSALADEDEQAAALFDLSWRFVSEPAREVFAALALAPGDDVGANLVSAWLRQAATAEGLARPERLLADLANASLLIASSEGGRRYRYHDRVRDYALGKRTLPDEEVRRRLLACYTDWDMVKGELDAVGAFALAGQYHRLRGWGVETVPDFEPWYHFVRGQAPLLGAHPPLFFQQAYNEAADSPVSRAAQQRARTKQAPDRWLEWWNRPREFVPPACLQVLTGHKRGVHGVALSADGRTAVSGAKDRTVRVWDLVRGQCRAVLTGHTGGVTSVALSADGRAAVSGADDHTVRVWDLDTDRERLILTGHTDAVTSVALSADGRTAVSGAKDQTVRVWDLTSGQCHAVLTGHTGAVTSVALSADGRTAVSGGEDGSVRVWGLAAGQGLRNHLADTTAITGVALSGDGGTAVSGQENGKVRVWDLAPGRPRRNSTLAARRRARGRVFRLRDAHTGTTTVVAVSADGLTSVSGGWDKTLQVWDLTTGRWRDSLAGHTGWVTSVALSADGRTAVSASEDGTVRVWDLAPGQPLGTLHGHTRAVTAVAVSGDGRVAVSGTWEGAVRVWDLVRGDCRAALAGHLVPVRSVAVSGDGRLAVSAAWDGTVYEWDLASGQGRALSPGEAPEAATARGRPVPTAGSATVRCGTLFLEVVAAGTAAVLARFPGQFSAADCSADGRSVVAGDGRGQVYLLRLRSRGD